MMHGLRIAALAIAVGLWLTAAAVADSPRLELPVQCDFRNECYVQAYVDRDPGPGAADYRCGDLVYDGHNGTDFRIRDLELMDKGVPVLAAAAGRVVKVRDGVRDVSMKMFGAKITRFGGAGNMVQIDHGDGWQALYGHMRRGSVRVKPGDVVKAGQPIGLVGMSGMAEFPHLHLELAHNGRIVDPFVGPTDATGCQVDAHPLWTDTAMASLAYRRSLLIGAGFSEVPLTREALLYGINVRTRLPKNAANLVFNVDFAGLHAGDRYVIRILAPDGSVFAQKSDPVDRNVMVRFDLIGRRLANKPGWPIGDYRGQFILFRIENGRQQVFIEHTETLRVE